MAMDSLITELGRAINGIKAILDSDGKDLSKEQERVWLKMRPINISLFRKFQRRIDKESELFDCANAKV